MDNYHKSFTSLLLLQLAECTRKKKCALSFKNINKYLDVIGACIIRPLNLS